MFVEEVTIFKFLGWGHRGVTRADTYCLSRFPQGNIHAPVTHPALTRLCSDFRMELDHNGRLCTVDFRLARIKGGSAEAIDGQNTHF